MTIRKPALTTCGALSAALLILSTHTVAQSTSPALTTLYSFTGENGDGYVPSGTLVFGPKDGALYGTTEEGGAEIGAGGGTVFKLSPPEIAGQAWTETILHKFTAQNYGPDGAGPNSGLVFGAKGEIYGTTFGGGLSGYGTVFKVTPPATADGTWTEAVLYTFLGGADGANPDQSALVFGDGRLFGTTLDGGGTGCHEVGCGTVFELTPPAAPGGVWTERVIHSFGDAGDGINPQAGLVVGNDGNLYGTTAIGGSTGLGTIFELTPPATAGGAWTETVLYSFTGGADGGHPSAKLIPGNTGVLYGASLGSDGAPYGTLFSLTPPAVAGGDWTLAVLYTFRGGADGKLPGGIVPHGDKGAFVGVTVAGGISNYGTIFELTPPAAAGGIWTGKTLYRLRGGTAGANPVQDLVVGKRGALYGVTFSGGLDAPNCTTFGGCGTVFELKF
jgi:uncharacterized repeat protein (TIGR03803 family)